LAGQGKVCSKRHASFWKIERVWWIARHGASRRIRWREARVISSPAVC
jgi:hypothetical protein